MVTIKSLPWVSEESWTSFKTIETVKDYAEFWNWTECILYYKCQGVESGSLNEIINYKF